jgi:hypothetical protein
MNLNVNLNIHQKQSLPKIDSKQIIHSKSNSQPMLILNKLKSKVNQFLI